MITDVITQKQEERDSDDDVIEVVRDEVPIEISDDDEENPPPTSHPTVIKNYHPIPIALPQPEPKVPESDPKQPNPEPKVPEPDPKEPNPEPKEPEPLLPVGPLGQASHTDVENKPLPNVEKQLLGEPPFPSPDNISEVTPNLETNGNHIVDTAIPSKLPILLSGSTLTEIDLNNSENLVPSRDLEVSPGNDSAKDAI